MSALTSDEIKKLEIMYAGDKARDATSKIRGFLYQDYVTIRCLLQDNVEYVCSEYLEDIDVFYDDGKFEYIQVKYYPASEPKLDEISTDLYYQYQRLMLLQSKLKVVPQLYIHRERKTRKLTKKRLENYVRKIAGIPNLLTSKENDDIELWLEQNINIITDKDKQKKIFFDKWASIESIEKFVDVMKIVHTENISDYKQKLMKKLSDTYPNPVEEGDDEKWGMILLGLAIIYIQRRYNVEQNSFNSIRMTRIEFDKYMKSYTQTKTEKTIVAYLLECITEVYNSIIMYNTSLSNMKKIMLDRICHEKPMDTLCDVWDNRIRVFTIINGKSETIRKLKYNIVLLIVYSSDRPDKSQEGNLMITRKIFIRGDMAVKDQIEIADEEVIDLPFHIIPSDEFIPNLEKTRKLNQLTACDEELLKYLKAKHQRNRVRSKASITNKSIPDLDYNKIKEWLQHDHS